jgi:hypothetical protein
MAHSISRRSRTSKYQSDTTHLTPAPPSPTSANAGSSVARSCIGPSLARSEKEIMLATEELRRRSKCFGQRYCLTRKRLAEFLQSVEGEEALHLQRLRDRELKTTRNPGLTAGSAWIETVPAADRPVLESEESSSASNAPIPMSTVYEEF